MSKFVTLNELYHTLEELQTQNIKLKKQLKYLRSGEYYNQLRFENKMLQDIVDNDELSKEDKEFIDMTHRNTELLEENQKYKEVIDKATDIINYYLKEDYSIYTENEIEVDLIVKLRNILKEVE